MRWMLAVAALAAALCFDAPASLAYSGNERWCAVVSVGDGGVIEDCSYRTIEECVPNVLAGNRGFCNLNPRWEGVTSPAAKHRPHHKRRVNRD
jgi:hypothetical protein